VLDHAGNEVVMSAGGVRSAAVVLAAAAGAFIGALYLWGLLVSWAGDPSLSGGTCEAARGYIVMDESDVIAGTKEITWFPLPVTKCVWSGGSKTDFSAWQLLGGPVALGVAGAVGWGLGRADEHDDELNEVDA